MNKTINNKLKPSNISLLIFVCMLMASPVYAQSGLKTDTIAPKQDSTVKYLTPWEYAFMMNEETTWLFKTDVISTNKFINNLTVGIEKRIAPDFTLNIEINYLAISKNYYERGSLYNADFTLNASLESRWYYRMNKRVKEDKVARNMSDNYLAVGFTHDLMDLSSNAIFFYAKWGFQRRFLKYGHVDFGVKLGTYIHLNSNSPNNAPLLFFSNFINLGLAFTKDKYKLDRKGLCPVLKCYQAENFIIKSNLSSLFSISFIKNNKSVNIAPHIAFERKIGSSAFSVNTELQPFFNYYYWISDDQNHDEQIDEGIRIGMDFILEGRWYYNLKRRVLKGKSGNGLSASYIALGSDLQYQDKYYRNTRSFSLDNIYPQFYITTGWQQLFGKHLYFDFSVGVGYNIATKYETGDIYPRFSLAVGYRF